MGWKLTRLGGLASMGVLIFGGAGPVEAAVTGHPPGEAAPGHPLHLTFGKVVVTGAVATLEIRIFWDDLELEVREHFADRSIRVRGDRADGAQVASYINDRLLIGFDGTPTRGTLVEWSVDGDANRYVLRYDLPSPPRELDVRHRILLDLYEDQKNVLHVQRDGGRERAFYFARRAEEQKIRL